jgi:iron-sulfur cluster assembly accessory protein
VDTDTQSKPGVTMSAAAARRIAKITASQPTGTLLRLEVIGGGCSGFSYRFGFADKIEADDVVVERDGARAVIDPASLPFLEGSEIDFVDELIGQAFKVNNPNATSGCGCGTSFSL